MGLRGPIDVLPPAAESPAGSRIASPVTGRVGFVGRLNPSKRVDHIIEAVALARRSTPHISLEIVGTGPKSEVRRLERVVRKLGVEDAVTFRGRVDDAQRDASLAQFDVLTMASCREGWGLVVTEAAHFGVPSAVYPIPGLIDSTIDEVTGLYAKSSTPQALAAAIERIVCDRALRAKLGAAAKAYAARFTRSAMIDGFEKIMAARFPAGAEMVKAS
jgi:glycosyltransferase involved in cell wall biosynthesis